MPDTKESAARKNHLVLAAIVALLVLTGVMLLALFSGTTPHPPLEVPPFAIGPFLGASLAIGAAAFHLINHDMDHGSSLAVLFVLTALVSFGPQKYLDPEFSRIWPAVITAQLAALVILIPTIASFRKRQRAP